MKANPLFLHEERRSIMKKVVTTIGVLVITACFLYGSVAFADMPGADPEELWHYITKVSPYKEWSFWPDHQGLQPGRAPPWTVT
jgi:hypothetical protein